MVVVGVVVASSVWDAKRRDPLSPTWWTSSGEGDTVKLLTRGAAQSVQNTKNDFTGAEKPQKVANKLGEHNPVVDPFKSHN